MSIINQNLEKEIKKNMSEKQIEIALQLIKDIESNRRTIGQIENNILGEIEDLLEE